MIFLTLSMLTFVDGLFHSQAELLLNSLNNFKVFIVFFL